MSLDLRAFLIVYVDGDAASPGLFREALSDRRAVRTAGCSAEALHRFEQSEAVELNAERALPTVSGVELLERPAFGVSLPPWRCAEQAPCEVRSDSFAAIAQLKRLLMRVPRAGAAEAELQRRRDAGRVNAATLRVVRAAVDKLARLAVRVRAALSLLCEPPVPRQLLPNLLLNSAAATPVERTQTSRVQMVMVNQDERFLISVRDNGPKSAPGLDKRIVEPWLTTTDNRIGLGLAICRELVTRAHGTISVESRPEGGARFDFAMPAAKWTSRRGVRPTQTGDKGSPRPKNARC